MYIFTQNSIYQMRNLGIKYISKLILSFLIIISFTTCKTENNPCEGLLFGSPVSGVTGLNSNQCKPICACKNFISKSFTSEELTALRSWKLIKPYEELTTNPYRQTVPESEPCLCAVIVEDMDKKEYRLETFKDKNEAKAAGGIVTHYDACGVCSTLEDLALYAENIDIGASVKDCGLKNLFSPFRDLVSCIEGLGFTKPCAQIWAYNVRNTQDKCIQYCIGNDPYNERDGSLGPCLECDEIRSGPVFKYVAGRTRRNTGIANAICRLCDEVQPVKHNYPF